jgi:hypothetical protein
MTFGRALGAAALPSYSAAAEMLEGKRAGAINLAGVTIIRASTYALALRIAGIKDPTRLAKASVIASALSSAVLVVSVMAARRSE